MRTICSLSLRDGEDVSSVVSPNNFENHDLRELEEFAESVVPADEFDLVELGRFVFDKLDGRRSRPAIVDFEIVEPQ